MVNKSFPKLKFHLNKSLDKEVCFNFLEHKKAGADFGAAIIRLYPQLVKAKGLPPKQKQLLVNKYIDKYYQAQKERLNLACKEAEKQWQKIEKQFYLATDKIFSHPWPKGKYIAYLSIFNCNPRFLETKTFQLFWRDSRGYPAIIAHEMVHFLFYDYLEKHFPQAENISADKIWSLSEVINFFILDSSPFHHLIGQKESLYPDLDTQAHKLLPVWKKSKNFRNFLSSSLKFLRNWPKPLQSTR